MAFCSVLVLSLVLEQGRAEDQTCSNNIPETIRLYQEKDFSHLIGMDGFSERMLTDHFALYSGYVRNTNKLLIELRSLLDGGYEETAGYAELKRRLGWETNGIKLHEYYFENLGGDGRLDPSGALHKEIELQFGSFEVWKKEFKAIGAMRGIGWVALLRDAETGLLANFWIEQHDEGFPAGFVPVLVLDVFEHAYITDYGLQRRAYIEAFFQNIDWPAAEKRFSQSEN